LLDKDRRITPNTKKPTEEIFPDKY
jgi:hypothetical protein